MSRGYRLMAVHAHPDDESSKGAASTARYAREGADVLVVSLTGGERGDVLNPALSHVMPGAELVELRRREMALAAQTLGVHHAWLGFIDSGLPEGDPLPPLPEDAFAVQPLDVATERLVRLIREFRPHVLTTYDPDGGYPHPDHIRCHEVSVAAFDAAANAEAFPEAGDPWSVAKLYYHCGWHHERIAALHASALAEGLDSPYGDPRFAAMLDGSAEVKWPPTTFVECGDYFEVRDAALRAHATQVDPTGRWFSLPLDLQRKAWPSEDYHLAQSRVDVEIPEDDLFAGINLGGMA